MRRRRFLELGAASGALLLAQKDASAVTPNPPASPVPPLRGLAQDVEEKTAAELQDMMKSRRATAREIAEAYLERIGALDRDGPPPQLGHRAEPRRPGHRRPPRRRAGRGQGRGARSTASRSWSRTTSTPATACRRRPAPSPWSGEPAGTGLVRGRPPARGRGGAPGQGQPQRVGQLPLDPLHQRAGAAAAASATIPTRSTATPAAPARARARRCRRTWRPWPSAPRPTARWSAPPRPTGSWASSRPLGLVSRAGIVPIAHSQDTAGPMARTVADAAVLLDAMAGVDPRDEATAAARGSVAADYTRLPGRRTALRGARIGVARNALRIQPAADARLSRRRSGDAGRRRRPRGPGRRCPTRTSIGDREWDGPPLRVQGRPRTPTWPSSAAGAPGAHPGRR